MAQIDFPSSPATNQTFAAPNGVTYIWNGTMWLVQPALAGAVSSDTPPANPGANQLWFNSLLGQTFIWYNDGNTTQWVPASPSVALPLPGVSTLLASSSTAVASGITVNWTWPGGVHVPIDVDFYLNLSSAASMFMNMMRDSTILNSPNYETVYMYNLSGTPTAINGQYTSASTAWSLGNGLSVWGRASFIASSDTFAQGNIKYGETTATSIINYNCILRAFPTGTGVINGIRLGTAGTIADGYVRVWSR